MSSVLCTRLLCRIKYEEKISIILKLLILKRMRVESTRLRVESTRMRVESTRMRVESTHMRVDPHTCDSFFKQPQLCAT
jgi:hypothetical protein